MTAVHAPQTAPYKKNLFNIISWTALLVGTLDIMAAIIKFYIERGQEPTPVFKYIASGVFGKDAFAGGKLMIIWGIVFHYMIAFFFTLVFLLVYPKVIKWFKNKFITGFVYGLATWVIMNCIVVPLSLVPVPPFDPVQAIIAAAILVCMIGIPAALVAHWYYGREKNSSSWE
jgi:hypothetical protein